MADNNDLISYRYPEHCLTCELNVNHHFVSFIEEQQFCSKLCFHNYYVHSHPEMKLVFPATFCQDAKSFYTNPLLYQDKISPYNNSTYFTVRNGYLAGPFLTWHDETYTMGNIIDGVLESMPANIAKFCEMMSYEYLIGRTIIQGHQTYKIQKDKFMIGGIGIGKWYDPFEGIFHYTLLPNQDLNEEYYVKYLSEVQELITTLLGKDVSSIVISYNE